MPEPAGLRATQTWMQAVMTHPDRVPAAAEAHRVVRSTAALPAERRLELYRRGYQVRLLEAMRASYPALRHALGAELFDAFAFEFLAARPSRSYTLTRLGEGFADHLAATRPDAHLPAGERDRWPDFLVDLARLECAFAEVYDGHGVEGERIVGAADLPERADPRWLAATAEAVPCLRLLASSFPVAAYQRAVRRGEEPELPAPRPERVALTRRQWSVTVAELDAAPYDALRALVAGACVGGALQAAGLDAGEGWRCVRAWAAGGLLRSLTPGRAPATTYAEEASR
jgi:hypothetical protein